MRGKRPARLTTREWEVLEGLGQGLSTAEISERLFISNVTVRSHVSAILRKLRVPNRASAVRVLRGR
jgi:DNA-binding NarL/FixJ family response regulator